MKPFSFLLVLYAGIAVLINTAGLQPGWLKPIASVGGAFILAATVWGYVRFANCIRQELGVKILGAFVAALLVQLFCAFFKAPLDVDGLFYHLPLMLEALDKNQWGHWQLPLWHIQNNPKMGEIPNLCLIALGGSFGWRLAQLGHFFTGLLGALSLYEMGCRLSFKKPALYALCFWMAPIVVKQMGANYVDISSWCTWFAAAAAAAASGAASSLPAPRATLLFGAAVFLHAGIKMSGPLTSLALLPLILGCRSPWRHFAVMGVAVFLSAATWMIPNLISHGNPVFPLHIDALFRGEFSAFVPPEMGIATDFRFAVSFIQFPKWLLVPLQFFLPEPIALYDQGGGAWGFLAVFALIVSSVGFFRKANRDFPPSLWRLFVLSLLLQFLLMPGREIPRHGFLGGWALVTACWGLFEFLYHKNKRLQVACSWILVLQAFYLMPDRTLFRGINRETAREAPAIVVQNFKDIFVSGEPQHPDRWLHFPYVPVLRKQEPRTARIEDRDIHLLALYWGRHFSNKVLLDPNYCRWPYCVENK